MSRFLTICFLVVTLNVYCQESVLTDTLHVQELQQNIDSIYNFRFLNSEKTIENLEKQYPNHPFPDIYRSLTLYWKYFPITPESKYEEDFLNSLAQALVKVEKQLEKNEDNPEAIFFNLLGRLLIMQYFADNHISGKVIPHLNSAYKMLLKGFELTDSLIDFNFSSGVYNYYREYYPKAHPVYKPVAYFFPNGNATKGIKQLEFNGKHGIFLKTESLFFLVYVNMYFEKDFKKALKYIKQLTKNYPDNLLYDSYQVQNLLLLKKYNKAKELILVLEHTNHSNDFFTTIAQIYKGIILEKKDKNLADAEIIYKKSINQLDKYGDFANQYKSYAYFGLSRIVKQSNPKQSAKYKKAALNLAVFPEINFN
jgi:tetratricopeptide (TPR) repeat protein